MSVTIVTQCTVDRLDNLRRQLTTWGGRASVAVYTKPGENIKKVSQLVQNCVEHAENVTVAVNLVHGIVHGEPYPIDYLRNVALLEARRQQQYCGVNERAAVLLVDVDFCLSDNLNSVLHSRASTQHMIDESKVVFIPAFESFNSTHVGDNASLRNLVDNDLIEGFHVTSFPDGHAPTNFSKYWNLVSQLELTSVSDNSLKDNDFWNAAYEVRYRPSFEPYVVMKMDDVPLYDERFQGYGMNKVSHILSISKQTAGRFTVLPGVFLLARKHERSEAWRSMYGTKGQEGYCNRLWLKSLYQNFMSECCSRNNPWYHIARNKCYKL